MRTGRPPFTPGQPKSIQVSVRLRPTLIKALRRSAWKQHLTLASEMDRLLALALTLPQKPLKNPHK